MKKKNKKIIIHKVTEVIDDKKQEDFDKKLERLNKFSLYFSIFSLMSSITVLIYYVFFKQ